VSVDLHVVPAGGGPVEVVFGSGNQARLVRAGLLVGSRPVRGRV